ncbi:MAG: undecaprenyl-diphosphate phosphatase [Dehalococcoidia bacterium]|nr:undecaprenyl-diphosphate phosphatase [Dehalococcoidia bacterium]
MGEVLQAIVLGITQGITEFAPISSTAHLTLLPWLLGWTDPVLNSLTFDVALHMGTLIATLAYFARDWAQLVRAGAASLVERSIGDDPMRRLAWLLAIGTIPGAVAGAALEHQAETAFRSPLLIAGALAVWGIILAAAERLGSQHRAMGDIGRGTALAIGVGQALAIIPGVSRSGGTMTVAMLLGVQRGAAARFSFLLATPIMAGAGLKKAADIAKLGNAEPGTMLMVAAGFLSAAVAGYLCIAFLMRYLQRGNLYVFAGYRVLLALVVVAVAVARG